MQQPTPSIHQLACSIAFSYCIVTSMTEVTGWMYGSSPVIKNVLNISLVYFLALVIADLKSLQPFFAHVLHTSSIYNIIQCVIKKYALRYCCYYYHVMGMFSQYI